MDIHKYLKESKSFSNYGGIETKSNGNFSFSDLSDSESDSMNDRDCNEVVSTWARERSRNLFNKKQLYKKLPILEWLPKYNLGKGISDVIAGLTVGLTVIPQGIAYALVAELPPEYGLYSAFMGCFVYCVFGSSVAITVGPTAIMALMTAEHVHGKENTDLVIFLTFMTGIIIAALGILQMGVVIDFISTPVIAGFTSAAAITIASSQVKDLFGLTNAGNNATYSEGIIGTWTEIADCMDTIRYEDTILGIVCIFVLLLMRAMKKINWFDPILPEEEGSTGWMREKCNRLPPVPRKIFAKTIWLLSTARNAFVVCICLGIAYGFDPTLPEDSDSRNTTFILTGKIDGGLPPFKAPNFTTTLDTGEFLNFGGMLKELGSALIVIPLVAILENIAIAKAFAGGKPIDSSQEMIALGLCNIMGSFVSSIPTTGSFSRTAVNAASGVQSQLGGIFTGALVILALAVLMPACAYIPKASLAAVIITAVIFMVEYEVILPMYKSKKADVVVALVSFLTCLFWALEYGILVGVIVQVIFILYHIARPNMKVKEMKLSGPGTEYVVVHLDRALYFPSVSYVRNLINKVGMRQSSSSTPIVVDCSHIHGSDYTGATSFNAMVNDFRLRGQPIFFVNMGSTCERNILGPDGRDIVVIRSDQELRDRLAEHFQSEQEIEEPEGDPSSFPVDPLIP